jgi:hypothetical protein
METRLVSRAYGAMPPDRTRTSSRPRSRSIFFSSASAMMLRPVLAWQTIRIRRGAGEEI